ncbi:alpha/beta fold hydrolase [Pedobacter sandarakinus]|uniref:alpha/beta fold hydrolase n=1 Tax=Pedobacter sandarakinus TaxID=353156 RepID=UPI002247D163|nr:alpha/beta hydrolase [Pedobacter sandarakinus]MCX2574792.1 alpha/beta hydrolase [Pedobacter sandarakinus]
MNSTKFFDHELAKLSYCVFGKGPEIMLCFHGYGMHCRQFEILEEKFKDKYTFYGFDLFFHRETELKDNSLKNIKKGITKTELVKLFIDFCAAQNIHNFSVIGYSMGTHYATAIVEMIPERITNCILIAPSVLKPGVVTEFISKNRIGNKLLEKFTRSEKALINLLKGIKRLNLLDDASYNILLNEINTAELRFSFYACFTYLRRLEIDRPKFKHILQAYPIKSIFIFGKRDKMYPPSILKDLCFAIEDSHTIILDDNHEMIKQPFVNELAKLMI